MTATPRPAEQYTIRQKVFRILGNAFHVFDASGKVIAYCKQKAFRLREDIRLYTDESQTTELFVLRARSFLDFSTTYDVLTPEGHSMGSLRRKGLKSLIRDEWLVFAPPAPGAAPIAGTKSAPGADTPQIGLIREDSAGLAFARRLLGDLGTLIPQKFDLLRSDGARVATFRTHFNPFVYRLGVAMDTQLVASDPNFDDLLVLASACLIAAIEGRQGSEGSGGGLLSG